MLLHHRLLTYIRPVLKVQRYVGLKLGAIDQGRLRVLIFHDIPPSQETVFQKQLEWIQKNWTITSPVKYGYMILENRKPSIKAVHDYLSKFDIIPCGRYGLWKYLWSDEAILSGKKAAEKLNDSLKSK